MPKFTSFFFSRWACKWVNAFVEGCVIIIDLNSRHFFLHINNTEIVFQRDHCCQCSKGLHTDWWNFFYFVVHPKCTKQLTIDNNKILLWGVCFVGETRAICFLIHISSFLFPDVIPSTVVLSMTFLFKFLQIVKMLCLGTPPN